MSARRRVVLAVLTVLPLTATGCRALGVAPGRPGAVAPLPTLAVAQLVQRHNRNAEKVVSLEAAPTVSGGGRFGGSAHGQMALVRPRDFRLQLEATGRGTVADFGSNSQEYWIWTAQKGKDKEFYVGRYNEQGETAADLIFQPDWVIEALGLRLIPEAEARALTTERGNSPTTWTLVHHRVGYHGEPRIKKTIVDRQTGQVREHLFFAEDNRTIVARALPSEYRSIALPGTGDDGAEAVVLPQKILLKATPPHQEAVTMEIALGSMKVNQFPAERRAALFAVPDDYERNGYARVDLDERARSRGGATTVRETLGAPPVSSRVRLGDPVPLGPDGATRRPGEPEPLSADLPQPGVVRARFPRPPGDVDYPPPEPSQLSLRP